MAYKVVREFEEQIARWSGAKYGVAVESCCAAIFLTLKYLRFEGSFLDVHIPKFTYPGVPMNIIHAGFGVHFTDKEWEGVYTLDPYTIVDSALRFQKNMYVRSSYWCLSFHAKKLLPIGRGGMILTDDKKAAEWLRKARLDGRTEGVPLDQDNAENLGWNFYMTPEQAARGLELFGHIKNKNLPDLKVKDQHYPDLTTWRAFK